MTREIRPRIHRATRALVRRNFSAMKPAPTQLETGVTGRLYVTAREVAAVSGISVHALDTRYRPDAWASPRDFKLNHDGALLFALDSLPQLADALETNDQAEAARQLRGWAVQQIEAVLREAPRMPPPEAGSGSAEPHDWHTQWEQRHDR